MHLQNINQSDQRNSFGCGDDITQDFTFRSFFDANFFRRHESCDRDKINVFLLYPTIEKLVKLNTVLIHVQNSFLKRMLSE